MNIFLEKNNRLDYIDLLLLADPDIDIVMKYIYKGDLFVLKDNNKTKSIALVTKYMDSIEIKNIATYKSQQGKGYAREIIKYIISYYKDIYDYIYIGTANSSIKNISLYKYLGFKESYILKDFFIDNYKEEIFEEDIQAVDMIYLKKKI